MRITSHALKAPLLVMAAGFTAMFLALHLMAMRNEIWRRRVASALQLDRVEEDQKSVV